MNHRQTGSKPSFVIDTTHASVASPSRVTKQEAGPKKKLKAPRDLTSNLKCFSSLTATTKVPALKSRPGPKAKKTKLPKLKEKGKSIKNVGVVDVSMDLWDDAPQDEQSELITEQLKLCGKHKVLAPKSVLTKPNLVRAVQLPDPGISYNPSDADFKALVDKVVKDEMHRTKKEEHINQLVTKYYQTKSPAQIEADYMKEMTQGLHDSEDDAESTDNNPPDRLNKNKVVVAENRKTKKQRNREVRVKQVAKLMQERKARVKEAKRPLGLPKLLKEIKAKEKESEERKRKKELKLKQRLLEPKRRNVPLLPEQVVPNPADVTGSLRTVKVAGNLLEDRFGSLIARNLIEVKKKKSRERKSGNKLKERALYVKRSHRSDVC